MRKSFFAGTLSTILTACGLAAPIVPAPAFADTTTITTVAATTTVSKPQPKNKYAVVDINCGVPSGCVGELGFRPWYFLKLEVGAGYNSMAPGVIGSVVFDPIPWGLGLTLSVDAGHYWSGPAPFVNNPPSVEYSFVSPMLGLEFGNYRAWRFYVRGGVSYLDGTVSNISYGNNDQSLMIGNPRAQGWAAPAAKIGFSVYF